MSFLNKAQTPKRLRKGKGNHQVWKKINKNFLLYLLPVDHHWLLNPNEGQDDIHLYLLFRNSFPRTGHGPVLG